MACKAIKDFFKVYDEEKINIEEIGSSDVLRTFERYCAVNDLDVVRLGSIDIKVPNSDFWNFPKFTIAGVEHDVNWFTLGDSTILYAENVVVAYTTKNMLNFIEAFEEEQSVDAKKNRKDSESVYCCATREYAVVLHKHFRLHAIVTEDDSQYIQFNDCVAVTSAGAIYSEKEHVLKDELEKPITEFYPNFKRDIDDIYRKIDESTAPVNFLIGPPGMAKSTFIRGYLTNMGISSVITCTKEEILAKADIFSFVKTVKAEVLIIEDCDALLMRREHGNRVLPSFLNKLDGVSGKAKIKIFITTNVSELRDIDPALTRPGRCFATFYFAKLTAQQARAVCEKMNIPTSPLDEHPKKTWTIAELMNLDTLDYSVTAGGATYGFLN
jgi:hypothetical protein